MKSHTQHNKLKPTLNLGNVSISIDFSRLQSLLKAS